MKLKNGVNDVNFQIYLKNKVDFIQTFIIYVNFFLKVDC